MTLRKALDEMFHERIDITVLSNVPLTDKYVSPMRQFVDTYLFYREEGGWFKILKNQIYSTM